MAGNLLLDTNIIIALFGQDVGVRKQLSASVDVFVPSIAIGELYFGAQQSTRAENNLNRVREFASQAAVLSCDAVTAEYYGSMKSALKEKGRPLPENDIWIAALATQYGLTLITRDLHFREIDGLQSEAW